jgi:hypothetical protein
MYCKKEEIHWAREGTRSFPLNQALEGIILAANLGCVLYEWILDLPVPQDSVWWTKYIRFKFLLLNREMNLMVELKRSK